MQCMLTVGAWIFGRSHTCCSVNSRLFCWR